MLVALRDGFPLLKCTECGVETVCSYQEIDIETGYIDYDNKYPFVEGTFCSSCFAYDFEATRYKPLKHTGAYLINNMDKKPIYEDGTFKWAMEMMLEGKRMRHKDWQGISRFVGMNIYKGKLFEYVDKEFHHRLYTDFVPSYSEDWELLPVDEYREWILTGDTQ
jgi:hypothetical protein